MAWVYSA